MVATNNGNSFKGSVPYEELETAPAPPVADRVKFIINGVDVTANITAPYQRGTVESKFTFTIGNVHTHTLVETGATNPTCTEDGTAAYWTCTGTDGCGKLFSDENGTNEIAAPATIPALGHNWNAPDYTWADDNSTATAKHVCSRDASHEESETVTTTSEMTVEPTYTDSGEMTYTAEFEHWAFKPQTKTVPIPPLPAYGIEINDVNFPDPIFRQFVADNFDNGEVPGWLVPEEIDAIISINASKLGIEVLTGIEHFAALRELNCHGNKLTALDVSALTELELLFCYENELTELDVTMLSKLRGLYCFTNQIPEIDVTQNPLLQYFFCYNNLLTEIDVTQNPALLILDVSQNDLNTLDVSQNEKLEKLACYLNSIEGGAMDALIASLVTRVNGVFHVIAPNVDGEQNVCTRSQVSTAKDKGWMSYYWTGTEVGEGKGEWLDYAGSETPTSIDNGQLIIDNLDGDWYDLSGRKLNANPKKKGVYIVNGRKVVK